MSIFGNSNHLNGGSLWTSHPHLGIVHGATASWSNKPREHIFEWWLAGCSLEVMASAWNLPMSRPFSMRPFCGRHCASRSRPSTWPTMMPWFGKKTDQLRWCCLRWSGSNFLSHCQPLPLNTLVPPAWILDDALAFTSLWVKVPILNLSKLGNFTKKIPKICVWTIWLSLGSTSSFQFDRSLWSLDMEGPCRFQLVHQGVPISEGQAKFAAGPIPAQGDPPGRFFDGRTDVAGHPGALDFQLLALNLTVCTAKQVGRTFWGAWGFRFKLSELFWAILGNCNKKKNRDVLATELFGLGDQKWFGPPLSSGIIIQVGGFQDKMY